MNFKNFKILYYDKWNLFKSLHYTSSIKKYLLAITLLYSVYTIFLSFLRIKCTRTVRRAFFQEIEIISFRSIYRDKSGIISTGSLPTKYVISLREPRKLFLFRGIYPPIISWRILSKREPFVLSNHFINWFFSKTSYTSLSFTLHIHSFTVQPVNRLIRLENFPSLLSSNVSICIRFVLSSSPKSSSLPLTVVKKNSIFAGLAFIFARSTVNILLFDPRAIPRSENSRDRMLSTFPTFFLPPFPRTTRVHVWRNDWWIAVITFPCARV